MYDKLIRIIVCSCIILTIGGCSNKETKSKQHTYKEKIVDTKSLEKYDLKNITSFKTENANVLLKNSKALPHSQNLTFTPLALNDKGEVFGESIKSEGSAALLMLDVETGIYKELFLADKGTTIGVSGANNNYVLYSVVNQQEETVAYYCMNIVNHKNSSIYKSAYLNGVAVPDVAMVDDIAYISLPSPDDNNDSITYPLIRYDMKNNKQEVIEKSKTTAYPVYFKNELYYLHIDNDKLTTDIVQYNLQTKKKTILAEGNEKDGYFYNLTSDGTSLIVQLSYADNTDNFYEVEVSNKEIKPYVKIIGADAFKGYENYLTWTGQQKSDKQVRKPIYFFNSDKQIAYEYGGSAIYFSKKGILWVKYSIDESKIPKQKIFTKDYSVLMWHSFI